MALPRAYIYNGPGAGQTSVRALERSLLCFGITRIVRVGWRELASLVSRVRPHNALVCVPGGRDAPLLDCLRPQTAHHIRQFVERGGTYLGICSGAYFASATLDFAPLTTLSISGERPLRFFKGTAQGPTHDVAAFSYRQDATGRLVSVYAPSGDVQAYTLGGCALVQSKKDCANADCLDLSILARYGADVDHAPAARLVKVGRGRALLVGLHLEWETQDLPSASARHVLGPALNKTCARRARLFHSWLRLALFN